MRLCSGWVLLPPLVVAAAGCPAQSLRKFPDRPVAWQEHDDQDVPRKPAFNGRWAGDDASQEMRGLTRSVDRRLALTRGRPARDVNALDEVPCSTWFCPRNHVRPLTIEEIVAGPPGPDPPEPPFRVVKGKPAGVAPGFIVDDRRGNRFLLKLDPIGHPSLITGAELMGPIFMWAAGYNAPRAFLYDLHERDLVMDPKATRPYKGFKTRPFTRADVDAVLGSAHRAPDGSWRVVMSSWIEGDIIGQFDLAGRRQDDPNDRIEHEDRRSLRASLILFAWLNNHDIKPAQTVDTWIHDGGRHYVKHYFIDWGTGFGANTTGPKLPFHGRERTIEPGGWLVTLFTLGLIGRSYQGERSEWEREVAAHPSVGWLPSDEFDPRKWRVRRSLLPYTLMSDGDAYWGAKIVTSFTDEQIAAIVAQGGYPPGEAAYLIRALRVRRDHIGREYLTRVTAVEAPRITPQGLCFEDLAVARGALAPGRLAYRIQVHDDGGKRLVETRTRAQGEETCAPIGRGTRPYRIVSITSLVDGRSIEPAYVHLSWRPSEGRFVVVGLERARGEPAGAATHAAKTTRAPDPRLGEELDGRTTYRDPYRYALVLPRAVLLVPRAIAYAILAPATQATEYLEEKHLFARLGDALTSDDGKIGVRPTIRYESGFLPTVGLRWYDRRTLGEGTHMAASAYTAGPSLFDVAAEVQPWTAPLSLRGEWERDPDAIFAGTSGQTREELQAQGRDVSRYSADRLTAALVWDTRPTERLSESLGLGVERADYGNGTARGSDAEIVDAFCAEPGTRGCMSVSEPLVPGFDRGLRIVAVTGAVGYDSHGGERFASGGLIRVSGRAAAGIAGDPSRFAGARAAACLFKAIGERELDLCGRAGLVEPLGDAPVPFEELLDPGGRDGLRAFPRGRLRGQSELLGSIEYRWLLGAWLDAALFFDIGGAFGSRWEDLDAGHFYPGGGLALTYVRHETPYFYWRSTPRAGLYMAYSPEEGFRLALSITR